jgi:ABC-type multidrug transport system ATPase subunit
MSDKILKALMQLFAIVANSDRLTERSRSIVELFLRQQISQSAVHNYLTVYDEYLETLRGKNKEGKARKRVSVNSVKVLKICTDINSELDLGQKYIVIVRLIEFVLSSDEAVTEQETDFLNTVAEVFNIERAEYDACYELASLKDASQSIDSPYFIIVSGVQPSGLERATVRTEPHFAGRAHFLYFKKANIVFCRYMGDDQVRLNGQPMLNDSVYVVPQGAVIRGSRSRPFYFNDIIRSFMEDESSIHVNFDVKNLEYEFSNGKKGLHDFSFHTTSGELVGIMGGSGAGKSTLLNLLNGNYTPSEGSVCVNGINIHHERNRLEGVIGYVPQDDLLIDDLTVFENLFYNSKLCFGDRTDKEIIALVEETLASLGLMEIRDLKVGNVFNKTISGGQRKRLNIALELVRKPAVLFVDEPTSGLSSMDSENVMDLLKELTVSGKLIFVVIHQPSSDIFKLFDQLIILDLGGHPVYFGNPTDSLSYFKGIAGHADAEINECIECGNINPDLIFSILESKVVDEFGNLTSNRKVTPAEWYEHYRTKLAAEDHKVSEPQPLKVDYKKPSKLSQLRVYFTRDLLSKLKNSQYMLINFLEAPLLAVILAYFLKFYDQDSGYVFSENLNLTAYLFMCVIVALFMGLTVSAEEIIRDRKIQARESFLNLSRSSYLLAKVGLLFLISAIQTTSFVLIGNAILEIQDMNTAFILVLFSISCFSNMMGLNISSAFNSAVTIYILIPFLIIPQIILSGVIVRFDNLNPKVTSQEYVPVIGEIMASRWAFEALAVNQYSSNAYEKHFFGTDKVINDAMYKKDFWAIHMSDLIDSISIHPSNQAFKELFRSELESEIANNPGITLDIKVDELMNSNDKASHQRMKEKVSQIREYYINKYKEYRSVKDQTIKDLESTLGSKALTELKKENTNESLSELVNNTTDFNYMIEHEGRYHRRFRPVYMDGAGSTFIRSPFYVSRKNVFGSLLPTFNVNIGVIWFMTIILYITLYFNHLQKLIQAVEKISGSLLTKKRP